VSGQVPNESHDWAAAAHVTGAAAAPVTPPDDEEGIEFAPHLQVVPPFEIDLVPLDEFVAVEEPGAAALVGDEDAAVVPEGGDVMFYGDGGAGKTTLAIDLAFHLAAGNEWLGLPVARQARVLLVENEGPRPLFRRKLRRKRDLWAGSPIDDRIVVLADPWGHVSFDDPACRETLAAVIRDQKIDVAIVGPVSRSGMNEAGTLQEVRDFMRLVADVRELSGRPVAFVLIHHENKGGQVSGAWEGASDTLFHVQGQGHGRTRLYVQKARWSSANPGLGWTKIEREVRGIANDRKREIRDTLFREGRIVNVVKQDGVEVLLHECPERSPARLFLSEDPSLSHLRPASGAAPAQPESAARARAVTGGSSGLRRAPAEDGSEAET
jgi:hypothetical protein